MRVCQLINVGYILCSLAVFYPIKAADKEYEREIQQLKTTQPENSRSEKTRDTIIDENNNNTREPNRNSTNRKNER